MHPRELGPAGVSSSHPGESPHRLLLPSELGSHVSAGPISESFEGGTFRFLREPKPKS